MKKGDSGSLVVDAVANTIYGHVIAANPMGEIYISPYIDVVQQIQRRFPGRLVVLPEPISTLKNLIQFYTMSALDESGQAALGRLKDVYTDHAKSNEDSAAAKHGGVGKSGSVLTYRSAPFTTSGFGDSTIKIGNLSSTKESETSPGSQMAVLDKANEDGKAKELKDKLGEHLKGQDDPRQNTMAMENIIKLLREQLENKVKKIEELRTEKDALAAQVVSITGEKLVVEDQFQEFKNLVEEERREAKNTPSEGIRNAQEVSPLDRVVLKQQTEEKKQRELKHHAEQRKGQKEESGQVKAPLEEGSVDLQGKPEAAKGELHSLETLRKEPVTAVSETLTKSDG